MLSEDITITNWPQLKVMIPNFEMFTLKGSFPAFVQNVLSHYSRHRLM